MTGESPAAKVRPPELVELNMSNLLEIREFDSPMNDFIMTSCKKLQNTQSHRLQNAPFIIIPDHSLVTECSTSVYSPGNVLMYESDPLDCTKAMMSPCASEALASPTSTCSWKRDAWDQPAELEEESIDLTAYNSSPFWGQTDGPPIQEYLTGILGSDSTINDLRNELSALASPQAEFQVIKSEKNIQESCVNSMTSDVHKGLKDKGGAGPTLAQLNDRESVLDMMSSPACQTSQSWSSTTSVSLHQSESNTSLTSTIAGWPSNYMTNSPNTSANATPGQTILTTSRPTITTQVSNILPTPTNTLQDNNHLKLATLLIDNNNMYDKSQLLAMKLNNSQGLLSQNMAKNLPNPTLHKASLQELLCGSPQMAAPITAVTSHSAVVPVEQTKAKAQPLRGKRKRSQSPDQDSNSSSNSMERKWEEIRDYVDSNRKLNESLGVSLKEKSDGAAIFLSQSLITEDAEPLLKKIKIEPEDSPEEITYNHEDDMIKDEMDSDYDNMDNSDDDDDFSDVDSDCSYSSFISDLRRSSKKDKRYFWQYNTQSKGPKGKRLCKSMQERDPHCLADFEDPVFQPHCVDARYKHNGKARKGDGNDITPNPWRLFQTGNELLKLNKKINSIGSHVTVKTKDGVKSKSRREKNKFASRACRLKKKAQHEANKLKLFGLEEEHRQLMEVLRTIKMEIYQRVKTGIITEGENFVKLYDRKIREHLTAMIAGNTADYVTAVLGKVADGDRTGGINPDRH